MSQEASPETTLAATAEKLVVNETPDEAKVGEYIGQCKWFNDVYGYGFLTIQAGVDKGKDIFVHHTGICPLNSMYKTLKKGEYVNFSIINGENGLQAVNVTGIGGGSLMCDVVPNVRKNTTPPRSGGAGGAPVANGFTPVHYGRQRAFNPGASPVKRRVGSAPARRPNEPRS